ncbi:MAG: chromate transporter [Ramlibacter sp.]|jgi:chromate transporter|uniref:chromate transporter n=1 Tax=Ramlibacter sp. TaxID=1917967 RepID=UPI00260803D1|nr:chromate transporter [Ramlibacter sp.]MDH4374674.1 chromate transporter [Ramlibacter sp.]
MSAAIAQLLGALDWVAMLTHFMGLSLLAVAGAISTTPESHRYLVDENRWLTDAQFTDSIAIAQAAPGPNVLFIALLGWNVGFNAASWAGGALGLVLAMAGIMGPSSVLTYVTAQWSQRNRERREVRAFKQGMTPIVIALMAGTGWVLVSAHGYTLAQLPLWGLALVSTVVVWRTRIHLLWLLGAGALMGALGWV